MRKSSESRSEKISRSSWMRKWRWQSITCDKSKNLTDEDEDLSTKYPRMQWVLASKQHLLCVFIRLEEEKAKAKAQAQAAARLQIQDEVQKLLEEEKASYQQTLADAIRREKLNVQDEHLITQYYVSQLLRTVVCCLCMCISVYMFS